MNAFYKQTNNYFVAVTLLSKIWVLTIILLSTSCCFECFCVEWFSSRGFEKHNNEMTERDHVKSFNGEALKLEWLNC
jgi:hypothetical protein